MIVRGLSVHATKLYMTAGVLQLEPPKSAQDVSQDVNIHKFSAPPNLEKHSLARILFGKYALNINMGPLRVCCKLRESKSVNYDSCLPKVRDSLQDRIK